MTLRIGWSRPAFSAGPPNDSAYRSSGEGLLPGEPKEMTCEYI